jgi:AraC-like DNA-binding protein
MATQTTIASGNLATSQRTITGVLALFAQMNMPEQRARAIITYAGLPPRALETPDFPISLQQEIEISLGLVRTLGDKLSPVTAFFQRWHELGIEHLGVLGMAMRHAPTALDALKVCLTYPQLVWGHSRMIVSLREDVSVFSFHVERPQLRGTSEAEIDKLVQHFLSQDLVATARNIQDLRDSSEPPRYINFAFDEPPDWELVCASLPCPVHFGTGENCLAYPAAFDDTTLPHANPVIFRNYIAIAEKLSQSLTDNIGLAERVSRCLWAYTPPLKRAEVAKQLAMSERNLTRHLSKEGTSYAALLAGVQEERAKNFLRNAQLSVADVGYRLGYSESAAFTRAFKGWTGMSPLRWRNSRGQSP